MATTVSMPQLGETVTEGTILKWSKQVGDTIAEDEILVEISTDKVDTEVPSPVAGTILEILVEEGDTVAVGVDLVVIGDADEKPSSDEAEGDDSTGEAEQDAETEDPETEDAETEDPETEDAESEDAEPEDSETEDSDTEDPETEEAGTEDAETEDSDAEDSDDGEPDTEAEPDAEASGAQPADGEPSDEEVDAFFAEPSPDDSEPQLLSPVVRRLAREHQLDLTGIKGTGQGGRVTRKDVEAAIESGTATPEDEKVEKPAPKAEPTPAAAEVAEAKEPDAPEKAEEAEEAEEPTPSARPTSGEEVELDRLRVRIAENMVKSLQTAAHVWTSVEVDYERVERVRQKHRERFKADEGFSLTYLPFIARATIDALKAYPVVNSSFYLEEKKAVFHKQVELGIAIDLDQGGLVVARVRNADGLRMVGLAREVRGLAEKARSNKLSLDDLTGSTFTITNPGPFGSFMSAPVINLPNVAILSTETVTKRPAVITGPDGQDMIAIRHIGYLGLTWDHRAFDGSTAVLFLRRIKENLETWDWEQELA